MEDLGKGIYVDFKETPTVFKIEDYGTLRIQKGVGRVNGITAEQLELISKALKGVKNGIKSDNGNVKQTVPATNRTVGRKGVGTTKKG